MTNDTSSKLKQVMVGAALGVALWALAGCAGGDMAAINVTLDTGDDRATVAMDDGRAVIDVTSAGGIGGRTGTAHGQPEGG